MKRTVSDKLSAAVRRALPLLLAFAALLIPLSLASCGSKDTGDPTKLSFKSALEYSYLKTLNDKQVTINGYLATSSPADGSFIFLMNMPFQSCPFCKPNTSQLSNTMEVYPKRGQKFSYTTQAVKVVGKLEVASDESKPFTDPYGYEFNFKIVDAEFSVLKDDEISAELALWQKLSSTSILNEVNSMYEYLNFLCAWPGYFVDSYTDKNGNTQPGYFLYAEDAKRSITEDGAQFNYGYQDGYFDNIIARIKEIDPEAFGDLVANIEKAKTLAERALNALMNGEYTSELTKVEKFGTEDWVYTLNDGKEFESIMDELYTEYSGWLAGWEL